MTKRIMVLMIAVLVAATSANAQTWNGFYVGGTIGGAIQRDDADEVVEFDTNLDSGFGDIVNTVAGADAFSPGFCAGVGNAPTPATPCADDEGGIDIGGRVGYDWQRGRAVFGVVGELSWPDVRDGVTAYSTTPAFYAFERQIDMLTGVRARVGGGSERFLAYGTGGLAWGWIDQAFTTNNAVNTFVAVNQDGDGAQRAMGYQAGGGVEVAFGARLSLVAEYLFTSLDDRDESTIRAQGPAPATNPFILVNAAGTDLRRTDRFDLHTARVGLHVRF